MKPLLLTTCAVLLSLAVSCKGGDGNKDVDLRQGLQAMVLQQIDIPEGMQSLGPSFSTNAEAAGGLGGGPTEAQLNAWGRLLGHKNDFQSTEPVSTSFLVGISTAVSLYETDQGASDSFADRVASARQVDWQQSHSDLTEFQQEELARDLAVDDLYWIHLSGYQQTGPAVKRLVTDDQIVFRVGRAWGFLGVVSEATASEDDRSFMLAQIDALLLTQIEHTKDGLDSGLLD